MKKRLLVLFMACAMVLATACGGSDSGYSSEVGASNSFYSKNAFGLEEAASADYASEVDTSDSLEAESVEDVDLSEYDTSRKLVYNSNICLESKKFDKDLARVKELVSENGGYFESSSSYGNAENGNRSASLLARIPADKYQTFMNSVGDVGALTSKSENVDDITSSYVDVQARLKSLNTKLERLRELEANAENVTELLEIEDRINEVQYQIESYTAQKKAYDNQIDYSTVSIDISEVATFSEIKADTAWNRFSEAFVDSFKGFISFLQGFVIALIYMLPYLIILLIILCVVIKIRKKKGKTGFFKKNKRQKEQIEKEKSNTELSNTEK